MKKIILGLVSLFFSLHAQEIYTNFSVQADKSANLAFYSGGIVAKVYVDISSAVKKGDKLAELQNDDLIASVKVAEASLDTAKLALKFAKKDYDRQVKIKDLIDAEKFDKYAQSYEMAIVAKKQAEANLAYQKTLLERTALRAPFDGVIFEKELEVGDVVSGMMLRTVFKIQSKKERNLVLSFDQKYWTQVKVGQTFKYKIDGDTKEYKGVISKIYPHANAQNRKMQAEVETEGFVVGLFGEGYIEVPEVK